MVIHTGTIKNTGVISEEGYLAQKGFGRHGMGESALHKNIPQGKIRKRIIDRQTEKDRALIAKRDKLRAEYKTKVESGEIRPPTRTERLIETAKGHLDIESTLAARRLLEKRDIDWKPKELKEPAEEKDAAFQKAKKEAQSKVDEIASLWRPGIGEDTGAMRDAIREIADKHNVPYDILRKQILWEPVSKKKVGKEKDVKEAIEELVEKPKEPAGEGEGAVEDSLYKQKESLERKLATLQAAIDRSGKTDMPGTFVTGASGVPGSRLKKIERQTDRRIDRAVEVEKIRKELKHIDAQIKAQKEAPQKKALEEKVKSRSEKQFDKIKAGDLIDVGGNNLLEVIKKNPKTVVTKGGGKWTASEIARIEKPTSWRVTTNLVIRQACIWHLK